MIEEEQLIEIESRVSLLERETSGISEKLEDHCLKSERASAITATRLSHIEAMIEKLNDPRNIGKYISILAGSVGGLVTLLQELIRLFR